MLKYILNVIMKIFSFFLFFLIFNVSISYSQLFENESCGVRDDFINDIFNKSRTQNNELLFNYLDSIGYEDDSSKIFYIVPVKLWVYRQNDGLGGISEKGIKDFMVYLNYYYSINNTGIRFYLNPDIDYIDKNKFYFMRYVSQGPFQTFKRKIKGNVNVLVVNKLQRFKFGKKIKNYNGTYNTISKGVLLCSHTSTSSPGHEIGHFFGLKHPHRHWKSGKRKQEPVDRTRRFHRLFNHKLMCEKNGDGLCDTPAEPDLTKYSDKKCRYTGWNIKDNWGDVYKPSTKNIMSYTKNRECRNAFTKGQVALMLKTASKSKYHKYWDVNSVKSQNFRFDSFEPDFSINTASEIFFNTPQNHNFHLIYAKRKKNRAEDNIDFLYFDLQKDSLSDVKVILSPGLLKKPNINIKIYFEDKLIKEKTINEEKETFLKIKKCSKGRYYIKIEKKSTENFITDYTIEIKND